MICASGWKDLVLDDTISERDRVKLVTWDYPVTDKYSKLWDRMQETTLPQSFEEGIERIRHSPSQTAGFAMIGELLITVSFSLPRQSLLPADATDIRYQQLITCDLLSVGEEFGRMPYAFATQQGSPLVHQFNDA